jgi:hypothetical protein
MSSTSWRNLGSRRLRGCGRSTLISARFRRLFLSAGAVLVRAHDRAVDHGALLGPVPEGGLSPLRSSVFRDPFAPLQVAVAATLGVELMLRLTSPSSATASFEVGASESFRGRLLEKIFQK